MHDCEKDARQFQGCRLLAALDATLAAMRQALEDQDLPSTPQGDRPPGVPSADALLTALDQRTAILEYLAALARLAEHVTPLESPPHDGFDPEALQAFRRAALRDAETLGRRLKTLADTRWRSRADNERLRNCRSAALRIGIWLLAGAVALAGWTGWQRHRQAALKAELDLTKTETTRQALRLISQAAWQAMRNRGEPLTAIAPDMTAQCAGIDVQATLPNHPCRQAWAQARQAIFQAAIPSPGLPWNAPSEIFFDPWNAPYVLESAANPPTIRSAGPDGRLGTPDDIVVPIPFWGQP